MSEKITLNDFMAKIEKCDTYMEKVDYVTTCLSEKGFYVPYLKKMQCVKDLVDTWTHVTIGEGDNAKRIYQKNTPILKISFMMMMVALYTNIDFDMSLGGIIGSYDLLKKNDVLPIIENKIIQYFNSEWEEFRQLEIDMLDDMDKNERDITAFIEGKLRGVGVIIDEFKKIVSNPEMIEALVSKLGESDE